MFFRNGHGYQAIGAYKSWLKQAAKTPNIDRLTNEGMRFDREWHLNTDPQGYDHWDMPNGHGEYYNPTFIRGNATGRLATHAETGYNTDIIADLALSWLKTGRNAAMPFMLMAQFDLKLVTPPDWARFNASQIAGWNAYYDSIKADYTSRGFTNFYDTANGQQYRSPAGLPRQLRTLGQHRGHIFLAPGVPWVNMDGLIIALCMRNLCGHPCSSAGRGPLLQKP